MSSNGFSFDTDNILKNLGKKEFVEDIQDEHYTGTLKARGYVDNSTKGLFSGAMETQTSGQLRSLVTFFEVNYIDGTLQMWNSSGKELVCNTQNLNRLFRNSDVILSLDDEGMNQLVYRAKMFLNTGIYSEYTMGRLNNSYSYYSMNADTPLGYLIKESLKKGRELAYNTCLNMGIANIDSKEKRIVYNPESKDSKNAASSIYGLVDYMYESGIKSPSYKDILKALGITKGDVKRYRPDVLIFSINRAIGNRVASRYETFHVPHMEINYASGKLVDKSRWEYTARAFLEVSEIIINSSRSVGYDIEPLEAVNEVTLRGLGNISESIEFIKEAYPKKEINLNRLISYLYIDITMHQGITSFTNACSLYNDYVEIVKEIPKFTVFPRYLTVAHDIAAKAMKKANSESEEEAINNFTDKFKQLEGTYKVVQKGESKLYPLVLLRSSKEIVTEATNQSNCLASYIRNVVNEKDIILSLKKPTLDTRSEEHLNSYVSVQLHVTNNGKDKPDLKLVQAYKTFNNSLDSKLMGVLKTILEYNGVIVENSDVTGYGVVTENNTVSGRVVSKYDLKNSITGHTTIKNYNKDEIEKLTTYISRI